MRRLCVVLLPIALAAGCSFSDEGDAPKGDVELSPDTRLLENHPDFESVEVESDRLIYTFSSSADDIDVADGNVLVGAGSGGYLRRVTTVDADGNTLELGTDDASLTDAIVEGELDLPLAESGDWTACTDDVACLEIDLIDLSDTVLYEGDVGGVPLVVKIPQGGLRFSPAVDFSASIGFGGIKRLSGKVTGTFTADLEVEAQAGGAVDFSQEIDISGPAKPLYTHPFTFVIPTPLGPLPVVGTVNVDVFVGFRARASAIASVSTGVSATAQVSAGATYEDGEWTPEAAPSVEASYLPVTLDGEATTSVEAYARPEVSVIFYGVAGPRVALEPLLRFTSTLAPPDPLRSLLEACLRGELGFSIKILSFELADFSTSLERCLTLYDSNAVATEPLVIAATDGDVVIDTDTGSITRTSDSASLVPPGVTFARQAQEEGQPILGVFSASDIVIEAGASVAVTGGGALVLKSGSNVAIGGTLDLGGGRGSPQAAGPGGFAGGAAAAAGQGAGPGGGGAPDPLVPDGGGGGGGHAAAGGQGGARGFDPGGIAGIAVEAAGLVGGSGGGLGGGSGDGSGRGGGGGGALRIEAVGAVTIAAGAIVSAGGAGGEGGVDDDGGGGGGAGGAIEIIAESIGVAGALAANGGGGGAGANLAERGASGASGGPDATAAAGGARAGEGKAGGAGGAGLLLAGSPGDSATAIENVDDNAGGGGGAAGRILLRGAVTGEGVISPSPAVEQP